MTVTNEIMRNLTVPLKKLGVLTKLQLVKYVRTMNEDVTEETVNYFMKKMDKKNLFLSKYNAALQPQYDIDRKMSIAFWVFIHFAKEAGYHFCAAGYPSEIVFTTDRTYRITVCDARYKDKEMVALTQAKKIEGLTDIIVGVNLDLMDIDENLLPENNFVYAKFISKNVLMEEPKIEFSLIKVGSSDE